MNDVIPEDARKALQEQFGSRFVQHLGREAEHNTVASVYPQSAEEVESLTRLAARHSVLVAARGAGTAIYPGEPAPGLRVRFDAMRQIQLPAGEDDNWVEVEPGATWWTLQERLRERGMGPRVYPTSAPRSTVDGCGFLELHWSALVFPYRPKVMRNRTTVAIRRGNGGNTEERVTGMRGQNPNRAMKLSRAALAFRIFHAAIAAEQLLAIGYVWWCALTGRRGRLLRLATASLIAEGMLVSANHGDCPLGGLQRRLGDPVPLFELVLSPRAAKRAVPMLGAITAAGLALLLVRGRREDR